MMSPASFLCSSSVSPVTRGCSSVDCGAGRPDMRPREKKMRRTWDVVLLGYVTLQDITRPFYKRNIINPINNSFRFKISLTSNILHSNILHSNICKDSPPSSSAMVAINIVMLDTANWPDIYEAWRWCGVGEMLMLMLMALLSGGQPTHNWSLTRVWTTAQVLISPISQDVAGGGVVMLAVSVPNSRKKEVWLTRTWAQMLYFYYYYY